jgi:hypothetical protein
MPNPTIPTPQDAGLLLQDTTTKTATYQTPGLDLGSGFAPGGLGLPAAAVVNVTAADVGDGNELYTFVLQESADNVSFAAAGATVSATAAGVIAVKGWVTKRYVRLSLTVTGTTPSITFKAWLNPLN